MDLELDLPRPPVLPKLLTQHFEELDFLWEWRELAVYDHELDLTDLLELEERARRHLHGVRLGQGHGLDLALEALVSDDRTAVTAAAFVLLELDADKARGPLVELLGAGDEACADGVRTALRHRPLADAEERLRFHALNADSLVARVCAQDVLAFHRRAPVDGARACLEVEGPRLRAVAIDTIGRWRCGWSEDDLRSSLAGAPRVREAALRTSARLGLDGLREVCRAEVASGGVPEAVAFLGVVGQAADVRTLADAVAERRRPQAALSALGALGAPHGIPAVLSALHDPATAHAAARAFRRLTGADGLASEIPLAPPEDLPPDDVDFWDEHLEVHPERGMAWWKQHAERFDPAQRWQGGLPVASDPLEAPFDELTLEARRDVYLAHAWSSAGAAPEIELEASAASQLARSAASAPS